MPFNHLEEVKTKKRGLKKIAPSLYFSFCSFDLLILYFSFFSFVLFVFPILGGERKSHPFATFFSRPKDKAHPL